MGNYFKAGVGVINSSFECLHGEDNIYKVCSLHQVILLSQSFRSVSPDLHQCQLYLTCSSPDLFLRELEQDTIF